VDVVVLAAGRGERLNGITAPYHKPLLVINGKPLITQAVDVANVVGGYAVVVVSPENASPISAVLGDRPVKMIVQRTPTGPGHALAYALELCRPGLVLVLMSDNVSSTDDIYKCVNAGPSIGVRFLSPHEAERFTWFSATTHEWYEKKTPQSEDINGDVCCWVGPLVIDRDKALRFYQEDHCRCDIGPYLGALGELSIVPVSTYDIGVPEVLGGS
jgi:GTP:adenosylcobinamide-phosphate guanylyltransferase